MIDIHKIGAAAIAALKALTAAKANKKSKTAKANELIEERNETARPLLQQVHDAIVAGQSVNGQYTWDGWAKYAGWSKRALNYILNGRKPQGGNSSSRLKMTMFDFSYYNRRKEEKSLSMWADFDVVGLNGVTTVGAAVKLSVQVPGENTRETYDAVVEKMIALMKQAHLWNKETAADFKKWLEEYFEKEEIKPTPEVKKVKVAKHADPNKELMRRFRAVKRTAKFFAEVMKELKDGVNGNYEHLVKLYPDERGACIRSYPCTPPVKGYTLPKTEKEFQAEYTKAFADFDAVMVEGKAAGILTDAPREKKQVTVVVNDCPVDEGEQL